MNTVSEIARFWSKVTKGTNDECWFWNASVTGEMGYGRFRISKEKGTVSAHRYSYQLEYGDIPEGMLICHSCDEPRCVNPKHLFLGTHKENAVDRETKSRGGHYSKLTDDAARTIKFSNLSQSKLAKLHDVSRRTIAKIQYGETWRHITSDLNLIPATQLCVICGEMSSSIHIDVNYQYRKINDDLCLRCDRVLKLFNENIALFQKAEKYLTV